VVLFEDAEALRNVYSLIELNSERHGHVKTELSQRMSTWMQSDAGRAAIAGFKIAGRSVFCPLPVREADMCGVALE